LVEVNVPISAKSQGPSSFYVFLRSFLSECARFISSMRTEQLSQAFGLSYAKGWATFDPQNFQHGLQTHHVMEDFFKAQQVQNPQMQAPLENMRPIDAFVARMEHCEREFCEALSREETAMQ
jgi:hypothetical protein